MPKITVKNLTNPEDLSNTMINLKGQRQLGETERNIMLQDLVARLGIEEDDDIVMLDENGEEIVEYTENSDKESDGCLDGGVLIPLSSSSLADRTDSTPRLPTIFECDEENEDCEQDNTFGF